MLDPWAVQNSAWKKRLAGWAYEHANLRAAAACVQVNTETEYAAARAYGLDGPLCVIPNGVELPDEARAAALPPPWVEAAGTSADDPDAARVLLFLGRIHPKKGLLELVDAWQRLGDDVDPWHLAIVGWDDGGHEDALRRRIREAGLDARIHLLGPRFGDDKAAAFHHADAFILPSHSEGLPMAVLEAWSYRLPVLMTPGCHLQAGYDAQAALRIEPTAASVADGLRRLVALPPAERRAIGQRGRALVEARFTWTHVAREMQAVYWAWHAAWPGPPPVISLPRLRAPATSWIVPVPARTSKRCRAQPASVHDYVFVVTGRAAPGLRAVHDVPCPDPIRQTRWTGSSHYWHLGARNQFDLERAQLILSA